MSNLNNLEVIIPSYKSRDLTRLFVKSFEFFKPDDMELTYHIVENSNDTSYMKESQSWAPNVVWHSNPEADTNEDSSQNKGSWANCSAINFVKHDIKTEFVFLCHNDCIVTSPLFFQELRQRTNEGNLAIGTIATKNKGPERTMRALHSSGLLVATSILQEVGVTPEFHNNIDVVEIITTHCIENDIPHHVFENTFENKQLVSFCNEPWLSLGDSCGIDRSFDTNKTEVVYVHLGRGSDKNFNQYSKPGKVMFNDWVGLCDHFLDQVKQGQDA